MEPELPLVFSVEHSKEVFKLQRVIKNLISNVFHGTKVGTSEDNEVMKKMKSQLLANMLKNLGKDKKEKQFQILKFYN